MAWSSPKDVSFCRAISRAADFWARVAWVLLALFLYPVLLPVTGYLIATFVLIAFLLCVIVRSRPWVDLASALVITLISYVIFYRLLDVKFPKGMLGL